MDKIQCNICNKLFELISPTHLRTHNITVAEYIERFPSAPIISPSAYLRKQSAISSSKKGHIPYNKGKQMSDEQKLKLSILAKGRPPTRTGARLTSITKAKIAAALTGKRFTDIRKQKMSADILNRQKNGTYKSPIPKGHKLSPEHKKLAIGALLDANAKKSENATTQKIEKLKQGNLTLIEIVGDSWHLLCTICDTSMKYHNQLFDDCRRGADVCPTCYPRISGTSQEEKELLEYIKSIYSGTILENCRSIIPGFEVDIFLPDLATGFEYNGLYWHGFNSNTTRHKYHINNKFRYAYKNGVKLINIFADEWLNKPSIVKSRIANLLNVQVRKLYARNCVVKPIPTKTKNVFLRENHIQGADVSKYSYGAFHEDELVAAMTFGVTNMVKGGTGLSIELNRFCSLIDTNVVGIASKIFKTFIRDKDPQHVISYSDNRWGGGQLYKMLGFTFVESTKPTYYYTQDYKHRYHRSKFMKHMLVNYPEYDIAKTEFEIMRERGWDWVYDCGSSKWEYKKPD